MCGFLISYHQKNLLLCNYSVFCGKFGPLEIKLFFKQEASDLVVVAFGGAHGFVEEYNLANPFTRAERCLRSPMEWFAPPLNFLKVNMLLLETVILLTECSN
jgi:hypothetical protein